MNKVFLGLLFATSAASGQTCLHRNLSPKLGFETIVKRTKQGDYPDSVSVWVRISQKPSGKFVQELFIGTGLFCPDDWKGCRDVRSYSTGVNVKKEVVDNEYGDLVVADFNFDGKDDVALKSDCGGNAGPYYTFYIQQPDGQFLVDRYLTDTMMLFPSTFNKVKRTLTTYGHAGAGGLGEHVYRWDALHSRWTLIRHRVLRV